MFASLRFMAACALAAAATLALPAQAFVYNGYHVMPTESYAARLSNGPCSAAGRGHKLLRRFGVHLTQGRFCDVGQKSEHDD